MAVFLFCMHNADIDTLAVFPSFVERRDFFNSFVKVLERHREVEDLVPVPESKVPVIKFEFRTVAIDLTFARLAVEELPARLSLTSNECLRNTDKKSTTSLNGCRVTDAILASVPNVAVFRGALRGMKLWAERRGIKSNSLGYLGGVNVAIMTAYVAKNFPVKCNTSAALLLKVFQVMAARNWAEPMSLVEQEEDKELRMPTYRYDARRDHMAIITPAYPAFNSTDKV
ncbi:poly(A) polymerase, partial [Kipferlia bialata]|eukprot:g10131.t1